MYMKKSYFLFLLLATSIIYSQNKNPFQKFNTLGMETSVLIPSSPILDIIDYNKKTINTSNFYQAYKAIAHGDLQNRLKPLSSIKATEKESYFTNIIPLAILHSEFESFTNEALQNNAVSRDSEGYLIRNNLQENLFKREHISIASPLRSQKRGLLTTFNLSEDNIINTTNNAINLIEIDFNDDLGFRNINTNENITVNYLETGEKNITFRLTLSDNTVITRTAAINITYSNEDLEQHYNRSITTFTGSTIADLSPYGETTSYPGVGEYELFLSSDNILDKPIFLVDGFDPGDGRRISGIYDLLNFESDGTTSNLGDLVREEGYDIVILNFPVYTRLSDTAIIDGGVDFIERNAMLLVDLINHINSEKIGTNQNVIIGPSMGGLISRYALNYMENVNMNHDTRLWISFDSPHHGANVPIGFQHQFNFLAFGLDDFWVLGDQNVEELQPIINGMLTSSAARQMLTDQFEPHITNSDGVTFNSSLSLPRAHNYKSILDSRINALTDSGFPESPRKVSIINGSGSNNRYQDNSATSNDLVPGSQILNADINIMTGADLKVQTYFTPNAGSQLTTSKVHLDFAWWFPLANDRVNNASSSSFSYSNGIDAASGGLFDIGGLTEDLDTNGLVGEFLNALKTDFFNFIPTVSAMAFQITSNEINWFHTPTGITSSRGVNNITPFDAWYMPEENEPHVTLTEQNVDFALNEIFQETLSTNTLQTDNTIRLTQNPVRNNLTILSFHQYDNTKLSIIDTTGKLVYTQTLTLNKQTSIPINIASGLYILNIETQNTQSLRIKLLVK